MMTIADTLRQAKKRLEAISDSAVIDAEILLCKILNKPRSHLHAWPEAELNLQQSELFNEYLERRLKGEPIAHITGEREFWSLNLKVTKETLIPRPETELLVETVLDIITPDSHAQILDLGTGTGAIALALASERPGCNILATDVSAATLEVAIKNARQNNIDNVGFLQGHWFNQLSENQHNRFDIIVSNPPYIAESDPHLQLGDVRYEPVTALSSGQAGLDDIKIISQQAPSYLVNNGWLIIEHGYDQEEPVHDLFIKAGFIDVKCIHDLNQQPRITLGRIKSPG